jgi:HEPN domain-containing protein
MESEQDGKKFRDFAIAFLKEAKEDIESARDLLEKKRYSRVVFFCQQAVEKSIKALLEMEHVFVAEHNLSNFFVKLIYNNKSYEKFKKEIDKLRENLDYFEGEWSRTRYPKEKNNKVIIPTEEYKENDALTALDKAEESYKLSEQVLLNKFNVKLK